MSSGGHGNSDVLFDDLFFDRRPYDPGAAYGQSKTAQVPFAVEATRRWRTDGIPANALVPGGIWTNLHRHWDPDALAAAKASTAAAGWTAKTPEQGAATSVLLATSPHVAGIGGRYFEDCHGAEVVPQIIDGLYGASTPSTVRPQPGSGTFRSSSWRDSASSRDSYWHCQAWMAVAWPSTEFLGSFGP